MIGIVIALLVWVACAIEAWRWAREARRTYDAAVERLEQVRDIGRGIERMLRDHNARMQEWIA